MKSHLYIISVIMIIIASEHISLSFQYYSRIIYRDRLIVLNSHKSKDVLPRSDKTALTNKFTKSIFNIVSLATVLSIKPEKSTAKVFFDTDVYGDKELKIATVNKIKQKLRNAILQDISIAPDLLKLAISDALGFDISSQDGGLDGSILFELEKEENNSFKKTVDVILNIKKDMQRTNTVSFADLVAFGGAEAMETIGSGRVTVQVGRFDSKKENKVNSVIPWTTINNDGQDLSQKINLIKDAFKFSGIDPKDIVLLIGAIGEVDRVVQETKESLSNKKLSEDEDDEEFEAQPFVPTTFGARDAIYGAKMGKGDFGVQYFNNILKNKNNLKNDILGSLLLEDANMKSMVMKYATNQPAFLKEVPEAYLRLTLLGEAYTTRNS